jgi:hypothetical protein
MKRILNVSWLILLLAFCACSPKLISEKDLAAVQFTEKDLPQGFTQIAETDMQGIALLAGRLQKSVLKSTPTGKTLNTAMFTKEDTNADFGLVSFEYFSLSAAEKVQLTEVTKKQEIATCCEMFAAFMGGSEDSCKNTEMVRLISVLPGTVQVGDGSLECSLNIQGKSYYELGFFYKQNVLSFIFEGYSQYDPNDVITSPFELTGLLKLKADKLTTAGSG